jgi:hypothetical protein
MQPGPSYALHLKQDEDRGFARDIPASRVEAMQSKQKKGVKHLSRLGKIARDPHCAASVFQNIVYKAVLPKNMGKWTKNGFNMMNLVMEIFLLYFSLSIQNSTLSSSRTKQD